MQSITWDKESVIKFLEGNKSFRPFLDGEQASIHYQLNGVEFFIYRHGTSVDFYYPAPYNPTIDYPSVESFFAACGPNLSEMARDAAYERLISK